MFGRARFDLTRFDLAGSTTDIQIRVTFTDQLDGQLGAGAIFQVERMAFYSSLAAQSAGAAGIPTDLELAEVLTTAASGVAAMPVTAQFADWLGGRMAAGANFSVAFSLEDQLESAAQAGANIHLSIHWGSSLKETARLGADYYYSAAMSAILSAFADASNLEELVTVILGSIPPGSELRIDSDNFTVTLDGENILYMQEGDWIDLERQLWGLIVNGAGQLEGEIIYTERYL